jgi:phosphatidylethanolamine/phosphatidyl-N-methylethanolamine N-methyltransferase
MFDAGRKASIAAAEHIGAHPRCRDRHRHFADRLCADHRIVGVDYCEPMLRKAHERVAEHNLAHVEALAVMDAQHLGFPDAFFDAVVAQRPGGGAQRVACVTRAGDEIILVSAPRRWPRRVFEQSFAPVARRLGWRPEFG